MTHMANRNTMTVSTSCQITYLDLEGLHTGKLLHHFDLAVELRQ